MKRRLELARTDDASKQQKVKKARDYILNKNHAISSAKVEEQLKGLSLAPTDVSYHYYALSSDLQLTCTTQNAFSKRLAPLGLGFNIYLALVVDLMHEFELGVWKALFIHILRILHAHAKVTGTNVTDLLDSRQVARTFTFYYFTYFIYSAIARSLALVETLSGDSRITYQN